MKSLVALPLLLSLAAVAQISTKSETKRALPRMTVQQDYVSVEGHWEPREIKGDDIEITCVRLDAHRFFGSQKGYCLVAYAFSSYDGHPMVKTDYLDVLNWETTRVIAGHNKTWEWVECESHYVTSVPMFSFRDGSEENAERTKTRRNIN